MDNELLRVWLLVHELSDQLAQNQKFTNALQSQADVLKEQASHSGTGFALRRFNTDISKEVFESELERMNAQIIIENQTFLHENKQLSLLLKEYETTMETIMTKFRNHALAAQQHELTLTRHYETLLLARESQTLSSDLSSETNVSIALHRLSKHLRSLLRSMAGEDPSPSPPSHPNGDGTVSGNEGTDDTPLEDIHALIQALDDDACTSARDDWALERECEIARLERENEQLRRLLGIDPATLAQNGVSLDLERDDGARYVYATLASRKRSESASGSGLGLGAGLGDARAGAGGMVFASGEQRDVWGQTMPSAYGPESGNEMMGGGNGGGMQDRNQNQNQSQSQFQQQQQQQQQHLGNGVPLQRVVDIPPGGGGMRIQPRRPPMFTRGSAPPAAMNPGRGSSLLSQWPQAVMSERLWSQTGSTLDLSR
ncbi:hypothetical protein SERLA73DRAFT_157852 [Serpula lacrymans var. lacrymans S7.3]|uniref:Uncharacterized protein n=2 Tax=Serpula lacrymans var. lacrymans TaxID=341189 RepID=F8PF70_SERL3|nr:uncharacterized protein SERLADRAFT_412566 [Serpula lacrymans var. lacrymans S7.9]EGO05262.1 hypothetical protein SERLA73DRAFT_157852 [Serpula lacrymans var. lacrymans S7.3]EGO31114.1 hypothetical protein SERLADRAFT_412566 [Serpula lacrymans var. lacrymans S7.9]